MNHEALEIENNHVFTDFDKALILGKYCEEIIEHEFKYQGIPIIRTQGKNDVDFILPNGQTLEWKMDLRSQNTNAGAIEWKSLQRKADWYGYTFTYARIYTFKKLEQLYLSGKIPAGGFGDAEYEGRIVRGMGKEGLPLYQFINSLKSSDTRNSN